MRSGSSTTNTTADGTCSNIVISNSASATSIFAPKSSSTCSSSTSNAFHTGSNTLKTADYQHTSSPTTSTTTTTTTTTRQLLLANGYDYQVFCDLPQNIQEEILSSLRSQHSGSNNGSSSSTSNVSTNSKSDSKRKRSVETERGKGSIKSYFTSKGEGGT